MGHKKITSRRATTEATMPSRASAGSSPSPDINDITVGVSNIKDVEGFKKKVKNKLDEMIDPQNIQIFNVEKSKELYTAVKK